MAPTKLLLLQRGSLKVHLWETDTPSYYDYNTTEHSTHCSACNSQQSLQLLNQSLTRSDSCTLIKKTSVQLWTG